MRYMRRHQVVTASARPARRRGRDAILLVCLSGIFLVAAVTAIARHRWDPSVRGITAWLTVRRFVQHDTRRDLAASFIFQPIDCEQRLAAIDSLNALVSQYGVRIQGLMVGTVESVPGWRAIASADRIQFPVSLIDPASASAILRAAGARVTPVLISVRPDGRLESVLVTGLARRADPGARARRNLLSGTPAQTRSVTPSRMPEPRGDAR